MGEWQPIETAPKDGTEVLIFGMSKDISGLCEPHPEIDIGRCRCDVWTQFKGDCYGAYIESPTHWMPLPMPPNPAKNPAK